ncbi:MAG: hypothetical protein K2F91_04240 [Muribaculaceae bacterium]|nr:hypothetical protein [Muribaculaceae bacterium]
MTKKATLLSAIAATTVLFLPGCCIHEMPHPDAPDTPGGRNLTLRLRYDPETPLFGEYVYDQGSVTGSRSGAPLDAELPHDIRYTIKAYGMTRDGDISRDADTTIIRTRPVAEGLDADFDITIPDGDYQLLVWTDFVDKATVSDKYYDTSSFDEITITDSKPHSGSNPWRDAFSGAAETAGDDATVTMARPMAKYRFISTDLRRFIEQSRSRTDGSARATSLDQYVIKMIYTRYMPCSFNMFTNRPADSRTGVSFTSRITPLSDTEAEIGFDYVFVNGNETSVAVAVEVYDSKGEMLAAIPSFDVPLKRSRLTVVKGEFLTSEASGSTGINPGFDGDFNIEIK